MLQTVYLGTFYKSIKRRERNNAADNVLTALQSDNGEESLETIAKQYDIMIVITDAEGKVLNSEPYDITQKNPYLFDFDFYYEKAKENGGFFEEIIDASFKDNNTALFLQSVGNKEEGEGQHFPGMPKRREEQSALSVNIVTINQEERVVFLDSLITPVDATVQTLKIQLIYISVLMVVLSLIIALIMAKRISRPMIQINKSAKEMAAGNYQVHFEDKTYREIAELGETLNDTVQQLAKTEHLQKELIANVSHDLRTPLTMIIAYSEVMRDIPGENTAENVQVVIDEAKRLTGLVNDMLDISKLQSGVAQLNARVFNLTDNINNVLKRYAKLVEQDGYTIKFSYDKKVTVFADDFKISQVIYNLINNAINYTGTDKVVHVIQKVNDLSVTIQVIDTGDGIEQKDLPYVWERYYKVDKNHKRAVTGTGLGLSIVKSILQLHEADFGVESEIEKGSTFWFTIPILLEPTSHKDTCDQIFYQ